MIFCFINFANVFAMAIWIRAEFFIEKIVKNDIIINIFFVLLNKWKKVIFLH